MTRNLNYNKVMVILRGIPGCGKSTFGEFLSSATLAWRCSADTYMVDKAGNYQFDPKKLGYCHEQCRSSAETGCANGNPLVVIENTNTKMDEMKPYLRIAETYGYMVFVLTVNNIHGSKDIHSVPDASKDAMKQRFQHFL
jgi:predicted kinase